MAVEISTEKICRVCGAEIRSGAMFCYSCGSAVAADSLSVDGRENEIVNDLGRVTAEEMPIAKPDQNGKPFKKPFAEPDAIDPEKNFREKAESKNKKLVVEKETTLKTAASVRRQSKPQTKAVEVSWQEEDSPNILFIVAALVLALLAVGALLAMLYLR